MTTELPPLDLDLDRRAEERRERSRGIVLGTLPGSSVRLSKFTKKQIARQTRLVAGRKRSGLRLVRPRTKRAWQSKRAYERRWQRSYADTARRRYWKYSRRWGMDWEVGKEDWEDIWYMVGTPRVTLGRYDESLPFTKYNLYIEELKTGKKLYEGMEELMRHLGYIL